jgi:hypothetical protein
MKKLLILLGLVTLTTAASAHCCYRYSPPVYVQNNSGWIAPALIGGFIGYELSQPRTIVVEQQPVYVQQTQPQIQLPPAGYHWQEMIDPATNTRKIVLVPN